MPLVGAASVASDCGTRAAGGRCFAADAFNVRAECALQCLAAARRVCGKSGLVGDDENHRPLLRFLLLTPDMSNEAMDELGVELVARLGRRKRAKLARPLLTHAPRWRGWASRCRRRGVHSKASRVAYSEKQAALTLVRAPNASASFAGFIVTRDGGVFSSFFRYTLGLREDLLSLSGAYRASSRCPSCCALETRAVPCCLARGSAAAATPWLGPFVAPGVRASAEAHHFHAEARQFGVQLRKAGCDVTGGPRTVQVASELLVFQQFHASNYGHFMLQCLPMLLLLLSHRPDAAGAWRGHVGMCSGSTSMYMCAAALVGRRA